MNIDFTPFFKKYEELSKKADSAFNRVSNEYQECVRCKVGCSDCCHALFDLTLIEAIYINHQFNTLFNGEKETNLLKKQMKLIGKYIKSKEKHIKIWSREKTRMIYLQKWLGRKSDAHC